ncbi:MAG TPA: hypothetical protein VN493_28485 [Thermoanaerobaculia bacterium]|nr:hypothetical protein [Thermoanaerobaculia bacterium]
MHDSMIALPALTAFLVASFVLAVTAGTIAPVLHRTGGLRSYGRYATATVYAGLGAWAALSGTRK